MEWFILFISPPLPDKTFLKDVEYVNDEWGEALERIDELERLVESHKVALDQIWFQR